MKARRVAVASGWGESSWSRAHVAWESPGGGLVAVFAGMGPQGLGASVAQRVAASNPAPPTASARDRATSAIAEAHAVAIAYREHASGVCGAMATFAWGDGACVAHVGDARVYRLRPRLRHIERLTRDDVAGEVEPLDQMLTQAVGHGEALDIHARDLVCDSQDVLVCCTSRVWRALGAPGLLEIVTARGEGAPAAIVERLAELDPSGGSAVAMVYSAGDSR